MPPEDPYDEIVAAASPRRRNRPTPVYDEDSALDLIAQHESGGRNIKQQIVPAKGGYNPSVGRVTGPSTASGPWQITNSTWRKRAPRDTTQKYPTAISAPVEVQRTVAGKIYRETGFQDWAPYNASLRKAIAHGEQPQGQDPYDAIVKAASPETAQKPDPYDAIVEAATPKTGISQPRSLSQDVRAGVGGEGPRQPDAPFTFGQAPQKIEVRPAPFTFEGPRDAEVKAAIASQVARELAPSAERRLLESGAGRGDVAAETERRFAETKAAQQRDIEYARLGKAIGPRNDPIERARQTASDLLSQYAPGLASIDTPGGPKTDVLRAAVRGVNVIPGPQAAVFNRISQPREVTPEEKLLNPQAEATKGVAEFVGESATAFLPYIGAGKLFSAAGVASPVLRDALTFGVTEASRQMAQTGTVDPTAVAESLVLGGTMGKIVGRDPSLQRRLAGYIAPQLAAGVAKGESPAQITQSVLTNTLFALHGGGKERVPGRVRPRADRIGATVPEELQARLQRGENVPQVAAEVPPVEAAAIEPPRPYERQNRRARNVATGTKGQFKPGFKEEVTPEQTDRISAVKEAFKLPLIEEKELSGRMKGQLTKPFAVTYESASGKELTRTTTIEKQLRVLTKKQSILDKLVDCLHG